MSRIIPLSPLLFRVLRLAGAVVTTYLFFITIPLVHSLFGGGDTVSESLRNKPIMTMQQIPPKKDPPKKTVRQERRVTPSAQGASGRATGNMRMRFSPDIAVDAGSGNGNGVSLGTQELAAEVFDEGATDEPAVAKETSPIPFPERARDQGISGVVEVVFVVEHSGRVGRIDVTRSPSPLFDAEVRRAVAGWRFSPAKNKGVPVAVRLRQVIDFSLE